MVGPERYTYFMKSHQSLSIRTPEATSLARATSFNEVKVNNFFSLLKKILDRLTLQAQDIWNMYETGTTTIQELDRVVTRKDLKQIGRVTSAERSSLVALATCVPAGDNAVPPFFMFPRAKYKPHFVRDAPAGSNGDANKLGWIVETNFIKFSKHLIRYSRSSKGSPTLLLFDNHDSHLSIETLD
ncbi:uncharacterized protein LOC126188490 [Schistocerca cancellata]|uniref:uncharacterized protein LOC126188490 n=1 Tax=Schistocerca cancellata TaxID=274614 RepID=UPI002117BD9C|nr:uncharacterized protein LOC126188490 [Schistocerca cancellata]